MPADGRTTGPSISYNYIIKYVSNEEVTNYWIGKYQKLYRQNHGKVIVKSKVYNIIIIIVI